MQWGASPSDLPSSSHQEDLTVEDMDLIDYYWRQDADLEKGRVPTVPERQHERVRPFTNPSSALSSPDGCRTWTC